LELKITGVKTATVVGNYYWTFVRVYAGDLYGTGEGYTAPQLENIILELSPLIIGENALDLNYVYDKLRWAAIPSGVSGITYHAISAIEIAILDLVGKYLNVPVYTLLGGKFRDKIRMYVDTHAGESLHARDRALRPAFTKWMKELKPNSEDADMSPNDPMFGRSTIQKFTEAYTPKAYSDRAIKMKNEGFTAIKFDLDIPTPYSTNLGQKSGSLNNREIDYLTELVGAVREGVGEEHDIMFDLHWKYDLGSSIRLLKAMEPFGVMWIEDPLPPEDLSLLGRLTKMTTTPIASGENVYTRYGFARLLETGIPIITPDSIKAGGLTETRMAAALAAMAEVVVSPHNVSSPIGTVAQAHLAASISNFGVLEFHGRDVPIWYKLTKHQLIKDGFITLKDEPGLGVELEESVARNYALDDKFDL
jgi:L-alanine-DL-glutamate epimerase-like enolase superfamily enzyme